MQSFARVAPAGKEQVACASTEPGDSSAPLRAVESSEFDEAFGRVVLLQKETAGFPGSKAASMAKTPAQPITERAPRARSWGAPRARRGPRVGPTTLTAQGRQIRAPPPAHALGLASRLLITAGPLLGPHRRTDLKIDRIRGKEIRSHTRAVRQSIYCTGIYLNL